MRFQIDVCCFSSSAASNFVGMGNILPVSHVALQGNHFPQGFELNITQFAVDMNYILDILDKK
jgi:hypothetical protein